uniref:Uncharacterized protein n=1 Tax=Arion vulgaris TaxID=1028688 RepID=A0A0B6XYL8_9EUPU
MIIINILIYQPTRILLHSSNQMKLLSETVCRWMYRKNFLVVGGRHKTVPNDYLLNGLMLQPRRPGPLHVVGITVNLTKRPFLNTETFSALSFECCKTAPTV